MYSSKSALKIPTKWTADLAYFCGLITGDGSMPDAHSRRPNGKKQKRYMIHFFGNSPKFMNEVYMPLFHNLFGIKPRLTLSHGRGNLPVHNCRKESKTIYLFLRDKIGLSTGKKAKIAHVPKMPKSFQINFLAGLLDTDGGKKGSGFGLSTASNKLGKFCCEMFERLELSHHSCPWKYKGHIYHQVYVHKRDCIKILETIPLKNKEKIEFLRSTASVVQSVEYVLGKHEVVGSIPTRGSHKI